VAGITGLRASPAPPRALEVQAEATGDPRGQAVAFADQAEQEVFLSM
jgi:hypothetical protein